MKKYKLLLLSLFLIMSLYGCKSVSTYQVNISVEANEKELYAFSDEIIKPTKTIVTVTVGKDIGDTMMCIQPMDTDSLENIEFYATPGYPNEIKLEKDQWYRIGILNKNTSDKDMYVSVEVQGVEVAIECK